MTMTLNTTVPGWNSSSASNAMCLNQETWGSAVTSIAGGLIVFWNFLVIVVILRYPSRRFKPLHWFIVQLAVADFVIGLTVLWIGAVSPLALTAVSLMNGILVYGTLASATSTSTLGVLYIALDRYFFIVRHSSYKQVVTRPRILFAIVFACAIPWSVFIIGPALGWNCIDSCFCEIYNLNSEQKYCFGSHCSQMMTPFYKSTVLIGGVGLLLLLIASITIYLLIFIKVHFRSNISMPRNRRTKSEMRMIKTMLIVLGGFVLTTGPLATCCLISFFYNERKLHQTMRIMVILSTVNSILNPIFYFWRIPHMNKSLKFLIRNILTVCCPSKRERLDRQTALMIRRISAYSLKPGGRHRSTSSSMTGNN